MRALVENLFRRRFYVVHVVLTAVAALLVAGIVTAVAGQMLSESLSKSLAPQRVERRTGPVRQVAMRDFQAASEANIFEGKREVVVAGAVVAAEEPPPDDGTCEGVSKSSLRLRLVGTAVFETPEYSLASIVDEGKGAGALAETYTINACQSMNLDPLDPNTKLAGKGLPCNRVADTAILRGIFPERVCLWNETEHRVEYLAVGEPADKGALVARTDAPPPPATDDTGKGIKKTGENSYEVTQEEVNGALNNLTDLSTSARIVPAFEGGKTIGFKLFSIRPNSLYSKIGLQNGDVVTRINGYEMSSPERGLEIYTKLKDAKQVNVDVKRRGKPMTLDYAITP